MRHAPSDHSTSMRLPKTSSLTDVLHRLSEQVYQRAAAQQEAASGDGAGTEEAVEDAEYEVIDEDAKDRA